MKTAIKVLRYAAAFPLYIPTMALVTVLVVPMAVMVSLIQLIGFIEGEEI